MSETRIERLHRSDIVLRTHVFDVDLIATEGVEKQFGGLALHRHPDTGTALERGCPAIGCADAHRNGCRAMSGPPDQSDLRPQPRLHRRRHRPSGPTRACAAHILVVNEHLTEIDQWIQHNERRPDRWTGTNILDNRRERSIGDGPLHPFGVALERRHEDPRNCIESSLTHHQMCGQICCRPFSTQSRCVGTDVEKGTNKLGTFILGEAHRSTVRRAGTDGILLGAAHRCLSSLPIVPVSEILVILLAGLGAGAINAVVGSGTLITFPTLVAFGYPPVVATMSNAIGLVAGSVSGTWGYRRELRGQWHRLRWQLPASFFGALGGAWLLLHLPETVFASVVPVLLIAALILVVAQPRIQAWAKRRSDAAGKAAGHLSRTRMALITVGTLLVGVYGGYFTAAQGILLIGVMGALLPETMQRMNAAKNLLSLVVNVVAAVTYTIFRFDDISWQAAGLIAVGSLIGGAVGARYGRRLSPAALRGAIVLLGLIGLWRLLV